MKIPHSKLRGIKIELYYIFEEIFGEFKPKEIKIKMKSKILLILISINIFLFTGCIHKYYVVKPIQPNVYFAQFTNIDSLLPILEWQDLEEPENINNNRRRLNINNCSYDLAIFDVKKRSNFFKIYHVPTNTIYYKENIRDSKHKVQKFLLPNKRYMWGVRKRCGKEVGEWSSYDTDIDGGTQYYGLLFRFRTPNITIEQYCSRYENLEEYERCINLKNQETNYQQQAPPSGSMVVIPPPPDSPRPPPPLPPLPPQFNKYRPIW